MTALLPASLPVATLVAERLLLVPVDAEAAGAYADGGGDIARGAGWPDAGAVARLQLAAQADGTPYWLVVHDGEVVGDCTAHGGIDADGEVEIGYALAAPCRGRGLGHELVATLSGWLLEQPGVRRVSASTAPDNLPSRRALERAGFRLESTDERAVSYVRSRDA